MNKAPRGYVTAAVDGTEESQAAARFAVLEASIHKLDLRVAYAELPAQRRATPPGVPGESAEEGERLLNATVAALTVPVTMRVENLCVATSPLFLLTCLESVSELVVIGHARIMDGPRPPIGRLVNHISSRATCPIAVVPRTWHEPKNKRLPVVVAIDGETPAARALRWAFDEASRRGTDLLAVHVLRPGASAGELERRRLNIGEVLASWCAEYPDVVVRTEIIRGAPTQVLIEASRSAGVLVVGHPHTASPAPWFRSLARYLMASCHCPLVVVPAGPPV